MAKDGASSEVPETEVRQASTRDKGNGQSPVDSGYSWVIAFTCMFCNVLCLGLQRSYGILFVEFLIMFRLPAGVTALFMAVLSGVMSVSALLTQTVVLSILSVRQTVALGGFLGALGIIISSFATSLLHVILSQSVLVGIASPMILGPGYVIISKYFSKRRSLATGIASLGGNIGSMVIPLLTHFLLSVYGVRGALLVLGGVYLNVMVGAMLLRPFEEGSTSIKRENQTNRNAVYTPVPTSDKSDSPLTDVTQSHDDFRKRTRSDASRKFPVFSDKAALHRPLSLALSNSGHTKPGAYLSVSTPDLYVPAEISVVISEDSEHDDKELYQLRELGKDGKEVHSCSPSAPSKGGCSGAKWVHQNRLRNCDNQNIDENVDTEPSQTKLLTDPSKNKPKRRNKFAQLCAMFDFHLFRRPLFLLTIGSSSLAAVPAGLIGLYLPAIAGEKGVSSQNAALLLTIFGGVGIFSRMGFGYLADLEIIQRPYLQSLVVAVMSVAGLFTPLYPNFAALAVFSTLYGLFGIVFFSLMPVVIVDLVGLENMPKTLGFVQLFMGAAWAAVHPIIGHLRDVTDNYHASFQFMSVCGLLSSVVLLFTPLVRRLENRLRQAKTGQTGAVDSLPLNGNASAASRKDAA